MTIFGSYWPKITCEQRMYISIKIRRYYFMTQICSLLRRTIWMVFWKNFPFFYSSHFVLNRHEMYLEYLVSFWFQNFEQLNFFKKSWYFNFGKFITIDRCKTAISGFQICDLHKITFLAVLARVVSFSWDTVRLAEFSRRRCQLELLPTIP